MKTFNSLIDNLLRRSKRNFLLHIIALAFAAILFSPANANDAAFPRVMISYPPDGSAVSGHTYVTIDSQVKLPLTGREKQNLYLDNNLIWSSSGGIDLVQPVLWNTFTATPGIHSLTATMVDESGNTIASSPAIVTVSNGTGADATAPKEPGNLLSTEVSCDSIRLSWDISTDLNGSGVKSYTLYRNNYPFGSISFAAIRNWFVDTDNVKAETTFTYYLEAQDFAGNVSVASNPVTVTTPPCFFGKGEEVFDNASIQPSGRTIAAYDKREAFVYQKSNPMTGRYDSYLQIKDQDTGGASNFLLRSNEYQTDYILTSQTTLVALAKNSNNLSVNEYRLDGSPIPTSVTLVSSKPLGDVNSCPQSLFRLESGAIMAAWTAECGNWGSAAFMQLNVAYRSPSGIWSSPLTISLSPDTWKERITIAQHPADGSIWVFNLSDTTGRIGVSHFTETLSGLSLDWRDSRFIAAFDQSGNIQDGANGPGDEYPFLVAAPDRVRNTIDLAYQRNDNVWVYIDPLLQKGNGIFMKQNSIAVAHINADGTRVFNVSPAYTERVAYFGFSALDDGSLWLTYFPIEQESLTWNRVYAVKYAEGEWSVPSLVGNDLNSIYNWTNSGPQWNPGFLISRPDQPKVAFRTPDGKIHSFSLEDTAPVPDLLPPSIPTGLSASNIGEFSLDLAWIVSTDNVEVVGYNIYRCQGANCSPQKIGSSSGNSYRDTGLTSATEYTYRVAAYDAGNNVSALSEPISINTMLAATPTVEFLNPSSGSKVKGTLTIQASATSNSGISRIELYIDGILTSQSSASSLSYKWNTSKIASGTHAIASKAYDLKGKMGQSSITVYK
jgi:fibronectin type 3 domain-containing protein